jgi:intracellular multiplication protein IcmP
MMGPSNPQQQDNSMAMIWIIIGIFVFGAIAWVVFKEYIVHFFYAVRQAQIYPIKLFMEMHLLPNSYAEQVIRASNFMSQTPPLDFDYKEIPWISATVLRFYSIPSFVVLVIFAFLVYRSNATEQFRKVYNMERLVMQEKQNWPQVTPVCKMRIDQMPLEEGTWAMGMKPLDFCRKYRLLAEEAEGPERVVFNPRVKRTATLLTDRATNIFSLQVGRPFQGVGFLPKHLQALFAVFAARIAGDREGASNLLDVIARSTEKGQLNFSQVAALLNKHKTHKLVRRAIISHAYETTIMAQMLEYARNDGVLACADFLWLKPIDRSMWFLLNSVGRQTAFVEISGAFAHWLAEKEIGRPIHVPMVEQAIVGLEKAVEEFIYTPPEAN